MEAAAALNTLLRKSLAVIIGGKEQHLRDYNVSSHDAAGQIATRKK
jgi:hypothetical protein